MLTLQCRHELHTQRRAEPQPTVWAECVQDLSILGIYTGFLGFTSPPGELGFVREETALEFMGQWLLLRSKFPQGPSWVGGWKENGFWASGLLG